MFGDSFILILGFGIVFIVIFAIAAIVNMKTFSAPEKEAHVKVIGKRRARNARGSTSYKILFETNGESFECIVRYDIFETINEGDEGLLKYTDGPLKVFIEFKKD